ncbi:conserved Plasmodium protein, unknown function [Plasmodium malariae]|nr:conserved Plasmodium protein, unknown function [Plasmodium malariae]
MMNIPFNFNSMYYDSTFKYANMDEEIIEKLNPLHIKDEHMIDINYYEYVIEPFDFFFYDQVYNEICNYMQMLRNSNACQSDNNTCPTDNSARQSNSNTYQNNTSAYLNNSSYLINNLPFQYYDFINILMREVMNVRNLIYRNKYVRYLFYYIYRNNKENNLLDSINKIFTLEKKKLFLYKTQMKLRYNIFISRFFENNFIMNPSNSEKKTEEGINFIQAKNKLFKSIFSGYTKYFDEYTTWTRQSREVRRTLFNIQPQKFVDIRRKIELYSDYFDNMKQKLRDGKVEAVNETVKEAITNAEPWGGHSPVKEHEDEKLKFDVTNRYVEFLYGKNYAVIINGGKNNSRKLKAAYIVNNNLMGKENLLVITSIVNVTKWKSLFITFENITVYNNEESIIDNKVSNEHSNLIICIDFLPKILHITCEILVLDMCHFNILNQISILNDLTYLNFSKKIVILNSMIDNWNFLCALFLLNSSFFDNSINNIFQQNLSEEDKVILSTIMLNFISHFCILNKEKLLAGREKTEMRKTCFIITYMSGIQKFIYDHVQEKEKWDACIHPLLLLEENSFFLKDFYISEKFDMLKNIIKKFYLLKKKILVCYYGDEKLEKLIKILLYVNLLNDTSAIFFHNLQLNTSIDDLDTFDVAVIVNKHTEYFYFFQDKKLACYFLISTFTTEEEDILQKIKNNKELYFYKKQKEELMKEHTYDRDLIYRYYINNMISENDEQFLLFNIIDQKEKVYCNTSYNEIVLPTCFVTTLSNCESAMRHSEHWQDIKNAHSFWNFNNFNWEKIVFYLDKKNTVYDKYRNEVCSISDKSIAPPQIYYYLNNPAKEKNTFNSCLSLALDEIIQELSRKKELDEFDELKKSTLLNIKEKTNKKYFSSIRKMEKILSLFLKENKKKSFEQFLKGCESYGQILIKCKEKLFVTFNKSYNQHFKNFENFWRDEEDRRRKKWKELWELNEKKESDKENIDLNNIFNDDVCNEKNDLTNIQTNTNFDNMKNEYNLHEKKNFRIRLSSQLFDGKEFDQLFIERKKICISTEDNKKEALSCSYEEKKEKDKETCLYIERKDMQGGQKA